MKKAAIAFVVCIAVLLFGLSLCIPGICGCALSIAPANWEQYITLPALITDLLALAGCCISGFTFLVLFARRQTIRTTEKIKQQQM